MNTRINPQYRFASGAAIFSAIIYGVMRFYEDGTYNAWENHGLTSFYISMASAVIILAEQLLLRNSSGAPLVIVTTMSIIFTIGSYITTEWDHYYLATLGLIVLICLYGELRSLVIYIFVNFIQNIVVFRIFINDAPDRFAAHMLMSFLMYIACAVYVIVLFYLATKRESAAQSGLQAFSSLLRGTPNLMVVVDDNRRVRYISAQLANFVGMDESVVIGRPLVDLFEAESLKLMFADILDADSFYSATREIDMNNESHYYKIIADKLSGSKGGMFIEITDMTEIVLASIKAEQLRKESEAANKSKSAFLTTMSHEIRTPMNAIIGITEIQLLREDLPSDIAQSFNQIHASSHVLLGIINDILDLSKIETGKLEINPVEYDVASFINDAVQLNIVRAGSKPIEFLLDVDEDLPAKMVGDEMRLKQVLNNILSNAFKYTNEGSVRLSVSHRVVENVTELIFTVADTGQGMMPEDVAHLFEKYSRFNLSSNRYTEGTGLGMNITRSLVHMMDGRIDVKSEYGKGSTFTVTVLQQPSDIKAVIGKEHAEKLRNFTYKIDRKANNLHIKREYMPYGRVLIVDDAETNLYVAKGLLTPYGLTIDTALSGFEAISKISGGAEYDIVFMDHMMPKMDGVETVGKLREIGYKGTIIALTANAIVGNDKFFREAGFEDFISKPIDIRQMNVALNRYIRDKQNPETLEKAGAQMPVKTEGASVAAETDESLLEIFKRDARKAITALSQSVKDGDYKLFTTTAHAMRSAALNIGRKELSIMAKSMESAGNKGNTAFIDKYAQRFINELKIIAGEENSADSEAVQEDRSFLLEKLEQIRAACESYDGSMARALLKKLGERAWRAETSALLDDISEMVLCSDFEEAAAKAAELCKYN